MNDQKSEGYTINYKWSIDSILISRDPLAIKNYKTLSSEWFTLENYDKIFFSMSLLQIDSQDYRLKIYKAGIFDPEVTDIEIEIDNSNYGYYHSYQTNSIPIITDLNKEKTSKSILSYSTKKLDWKNHDNLEFSVTSCYFKYIICKIHLSNIDFESDGHRILSKASSISMDKYLFSSQYSDITIKTKESQEELPAHIMVLAVHSPVFEEIINVDCDKTKKNCYCFEKFDITTVKEVLRFMYTGNIAEEVDIDLLFKILYCANTYQIENLKIYCEYKLIVSMNADNIIKILVTIEILELPKLKEKARLYLECNSHRISLVDALNQRNKSKILFHFLAMKTGMKVDWN